MRGTSCRCARGRVGIELPRWCPAGGEVDRLAAMALARWCVGATWMRLTYSHVTACPGVECVEAVVALLAMDEDVGEPDERSL